MSTGRIHETDAVQRGGIGRTLPVTVLTDDGTHAVVRVQDSGLYLKAGDTRTVPSSIITPQH
ncbi:hypothetical protein D0Z67_29230 (plasmid) [Streptomyces seoulensis]|uniref:Uncharacterized protein n=1 Tax=Streptomyces seoulensis TaxID=73044 RepID=A0A4P6U5N9_STRSO|nr:hypothetical protein [Streptomyces seoulensis]QBJ94454.1 hypothetical protein D0Z67_29230 [Streptomyces seoulensis]